MDEAKMDRSAAIAKIQKWHDKCSSLASPTSLISTTQMRSYSLRHRGNTGSAQHNSSTLTQCSDISRDLFYHVLAKGLEVMLAVYNREDQMIIQGTLRAFESALRQGEAMDSKEEQLRVMSYSWLNIVLITLREQNELTLALKPSGESRAAMVQTQCDEEMNDELKKLDIPTSSADSIPNAAGKVIFKQLNYRAKLWEERTEGARNTVTNWLEPRASPGDNQILLASMIYSRQTMAALLKIISRKQEVNTMLRMVDYMAASEIRLNLSSEVHKVIYGFMVSLSLVLLCMEETNVSFARKRTKQAACVSEEVQTDIKFPCRWPPIMSPEEASAEQPAVEDENDRDTLDDSMDGLNSNAGDGLLEEKIASGVGRTGERKRSKRVAVPKRGAKPTEMHPMTTRKAATAKENGNSSGASTRQVGSPSSQLKVVVSKKSAIPTKRLPILPLTARKDSNADQRGNKRGNTSTSEVSSPSKRARETAASKAISIQSRTISNCSKNRGQVATKCVKCKVRPKSTSDYIEHLMKEHNTTLAKENIYLSCSCSSNIRSDKIKHKLNKCAGLSFLVIQSNTRRRATDNDYNKNKRKKIVKKDNETDLECFICEFTTKSAYLLISHLYRHHDKTNLRNSGRVLQCVCGTRCLTAEHDCLQYNFTLTKSQDRPKKENPRCLDCFRKPATAVAYLRHLNDYHKGAMEREKVYIKCACGIELHNPGTTAHYKKKCGKKQYTLHNRDGSKYTPEPIEN